MTKKNSDVETILSVVWLFENWNFSGIWNLVIVIYESFSG